MSSPTVSEQLVVGGRELISREGAGDLSVRRLVEAAGRSTMCVYTAFGSRKRLLAEIYRSCGEELLDGLKAAPSAVELDRRYRAYAAEQPRLFLYLFTADLQHLGLDPALRLDLIDSILALAGARMGSASRAEVQAEWLRIHGAAWLDTVQNLAGEPGRFDPAPGSA